jgi:glycerol-3-phosphate responsive antiterminator
VTLVTADDVVVAVVEDVELLVLTCGLGLVEEVDDVQPATKIVAITVATTSKDRRLFLMLFAQIALHTARI